MVLFLMISRSSKSGALTMESFEEKEIKQPNERSEDDF
jgi:hypothetical protein